MYMTRMAPGFGQGPPSSRGSRAALCQLMGLWAMHTGKNIKAGVLGESTCFLPLALAHVIPSGSPAGRMFLKHTMKKANAYICKAKVNDNGDRCLLK